MWRRKRLDQKVKGQDMLMKRESQTSRFLLRTLMFCFLGNFLIVSHNTYGRVHLAWLGGGHANTFVDLSGPHTLGNAPRMTICHLAE